MRTALLAAAMLIATTATAQDVVPPAVVRLEDVKVDGDMRTIYVGNDKRHWVLFCGTQAAGCITPEPNTNYLLFDAKTRWKMPGAKEFITLEFLQDWTVKYNKGENIGLVPETSSGGPSGLGMYLLDRTNGGYEKQSPQTARQHYEEILQAKGFNPIATIACFPEPDAGNFAVAAVSNQFAEALRRKGLPVPPEFAEFTKPGVSPLLYWQGFGGGIPAKAQFFDNDGDNAHWMISFDQAGDQKVKGVIRITINWATLRYRRDIQLASMTQPVSESGHCEPIP